MSQDLSLLFHKLSIHCASRALARSKLASEAAATYASRTRTGHWGVILISSCMHTSPNQYRFSWNNWWQRLRDSYTRRDQVLAGLRTINKQHCRRHLLSLLLIAGSAVTNQGRWTWLLQPTGIFAMLLCLNLRFITAGVGVAVFAAEQRC